MLAAVLTAPRHIEIQRRHRLRPRPHEMLLSVTLAGVCGTDLALYSGNYPVPLPLVPGHEFVGRIEEVGEGGDRSWIGRRATAEINNSCRAERKECLCEACRRGLDTHCSTRTVLGIMNHDGAFAEQICVPAANVHLVPDEIADREGVFIEPLAAALQTFEMAPLAPGDQVVVLGGGRLGYLIAGVAEALGGEVLVVSRTEFKCRRAREHLGVVAHRMESSEDLIHRVREWTGGLGASHVVEATGFSHGLAQTSGGGANAADDILGLAAQLVRPRGVIDLKSTPGVAAPGIPLTKIVVDEIRLQGSRCGPFAKAIDLMKGHPFPVAELIEEEFSLEETAQALERASQVSKVVIRCAS